MREIEVRVSVFPEASREKVQEEGEHKLRIFVREPALRGLATARVRELVARHYGIASSQVRLHTGARSPHKRFGVILS